MRKVWGFAALTIAVLASPAAAQNAATVIANASKAMGVDGLSSIHYYGVAMAGSLGQNNNANQPWPIAAQNDYVRAMTSRSPRRAPPGRHTRCRSDRKSTRLNSSH